MRRRAEAIGRKVPRSSFERDRRTILKQVPKLRKIKPAKPKKFTAGANGIPTQADWCAEIAKAPQVNPPGPLLAEDRR